MFDDGEQKYLPVMTHCGDGQKFGQKFEEVPRTG
jgi:hypothetical protein